MERPQSFIQSGVCLPIIKTPDEAASLIAGRIGWFLVDKRLWESGGFKPFQDVLTASTIEAPATDSRASKAYHIFGGFTIRAVLNAINTVMDQVSDPLETIEFKVTLLTAKLDPELVGRAGGFPVRSKTHAFLKDDV